MHKNKEAFEVIVTVLIKKQTKIKFNQQLKFTLIIISTNI